MDWETAVAVFGVIGVVFVVGMLSERWRTHALWMAYADGTRVDIATAERAAFTAGRARAGMAGSTPEAFDAWVAAGRPWSAW